METEGVLEVLEQPKLKIGDYLLAITSNNHKIFYVIKDVSDDSVRCRRMGYEERDITEKEELVLDLPITDFSEIDVIISDRLEVLRFYTTYRGSSIDLFYKIDYNEKMYFIGDDKRL